MQDYFIYLSFQYSVLPFGSIYIFISNLYQCKIRIEMFPLSLHSVHEVTSQMWSRCSSSFLQVATPSEFDDKASETSFKATQK